MFYFYDSLLLVNQIAESGLFLKVVVSPSIYYLHV